MTKQEEVKDLIDDVSSQINTTEEIDPETLSKIIKGLVEDLSEYI